MLKSQLNFYITERSFEYDQHSSEKNTDFDLNLYNQYLRGTGTFLTALSFEEEIESSISLHFLQYVSKLFLNKVVSSEKINFGEISREKTDSLKRKNPSSIHSKYAPDEKPLSGFVIRQYSLDGIFIAEYASYIEADKYTNAGILNIKRACKKIIKGAGGYQWRIVKENSPASNIESMKPIVLDGMTGAILCSNMKGTFIQHFKSIEQASSYTGVDPKLIKEALDGVHTFAGGYLWERV